MRCDPRQCYSTRRSERCYDGLYLRVVVQFPHLTPPKTIRVVLHPVHDHLNPLRCWLVSSLGPLEGALLTDIMTTRHPAGSEITLGVELQSLRRVGCSSTARGCRITPGDRIDHQSITIFGELAERIATMRIYNGIHSMRSTCGTSVPATSCATTKDDFQLKARAGLWSPQDDVDDALALRRSMVCPICSKQLGDNMNTSQAIPTERFGRHRSGQR